MKNKILIADSETTGLIEPIQPIEIAALEIEFPTLSTKVRWQQRYKPTKPVEYGALATSHILPEELESEPSITECRFGEYIEENVEYLIGHNIDYDWKVFGSPNVKRICTKALSSWLFPDVDSKSQSAMLYFFMGAKAKPLLKEAHNAMCDIENNKRLLGFILDSILTLKGIDVQTIGQLYELSELARIPTKMGFGKHRGMTFVEVAKNDPGWFVWWQTKSDTKPNEYEMKAIQLALNEVRK